MVFFSWTLGKISDSVLCLMRIQKAGIEISAVSFHCEEFKATGKILFRPEVEGKEKY